MKVEDLQEQGPRLAPSEIDDFERQIGLRLPDDYRKFLQKTNGGVVLESDGYFYLDAGDWWNQIHVFFSLRLPDTPDVEIASVVRRLQRHHPDKFDKLLGKLPIASDHYGNKIYVKLVGPEQGSVYFWMHDGDVPDDKLSESFQEFIDSLQEKPSESERPDLYP